MNPSREARVGPEVGAGDEPVLDGIVMDVMQEGIEIIVFLDGVFPEAPMPDIALAMLPARCCDGLNSTVGIS